MQRSRSVVVATAGLVAALVGITGIVASAVRSSPPARTVRSPLTADSAVRARPVAKTVLLPLTAARIAVISCNGRGRVRPKGLALACARGNHPPGNYLIGLHWRRWGHGSASGAGVEHPATCVGSASVTVELWRPRHWHGHAGWRYFTRMTVINKGMPTPWAPKTKTIHLWP
jgi:hypothetical protein